MADYNLLLVAIPEDNLKSEPTNQKNKLKTLFDIIFKPDLGRSFWDIFPQIFLTFRVRIKPAKIGSLWTAVTWTCFVLIIDIFI